MSEAPDTGAEVPQSAAARLFDLRVLIGGVPRLRGHAHRGRVLHLIERLAKASQININLWMGLSMLVIAVFFLGWWRLGRSAVTSRARRDRDGQ
jgi:hypothetical protein